MRYLLVLIAFLATACTPQTRTVTPDCAEYFDYAGAYASTLEGSRGDETWTDEFDIVVQQNGPAVMLANVLGVADSEGMSFGHTYQTLDWFTGQPYSVTYSGASRSGEPFTIDLEIAVEYPNLDGWDYEIDYVIYLGDEVDYTANAATAAPW